MGAAEDRHSPAAESGTGDTIPIPQDGIGSCPRDSGHVPAAGRLTAGAVGLYSCVRIRAGKHKGRELRYPRSGLRPTKDITRQAIFNILGRGVRGARVLDLYAGGGALGIEALSRGAAEAVFVEQSPAVLRYLRANLRAVEETGCARVVRGDVLRALKRLAGDEFELALADPPYRCGLVAKTMGCLVELGLVAPGGYVVLEHHALELPECPDGWLLVKHGKYGDSEVTVLRRQGDAKR